MDAAGPQRKFARLSCRRTTAPKPTYDFLSPWCEALRGRLSVWRLHLLPGCGGRGSDEELRRAREALELLTLVAHVDKKAWQKLLLENCKLGEENFLYSAGDSDDDDGSDDEGTTEGDRETFPYDENIEDILADNEEDDDETYLFRGQKEPPAFKSPRFLFEFYYRALLDWKWLLLTNSPHYVPSEEYVKAKARIFDMQSDDYKRQPWVERAVEIPLSLRFKFDAYRSNDNFSKELVEVRDLLESMNRGIQQVDSSSEKARSVEECASTFVFRVESLSVHLDDVPISVFKASRVIEVMDIRVASGGEGRAARISMFLGRPRLSELVSLLQLVREQVLHLASLGFRLNYAWRHETSGNESEKETREIFAKLLAEALLRPANNHGQGIIDKLSIQPFSAEAWQLQALFSALAASPLQIGTVYLSGGISSKTKEIV